MRVLAYNQGAADMAKVPGCESSEYHIGMNPEQDDTGTICALTVVKLREGSACMSKSGQTRLLTSGRNVRHLVSEG